MLFYIFSVVVLMLDTNKYYNKKTVSRDYKADGARIGKTDSNN